MPQYMLLIYGPNETPSPDAAAGMFPAWMAYTESLHADGVFVSGDALHAADMATTVRVRGGDTQITDGPFAETKETLIGYYAIDVADLDTALKYAGRMPNINEGSVEVRPIVDFAAAGAPDGQATATA